MDKESMIRDLLQSYQILRRRIEQIEAEIDSVRIERSIPLPERFSAYSAERYEELTDNLIDTLWTLRVEAQRKRILLVKLVDEADTEGQRLVLWYRYIRLKENGKCMTWAEIGNRIGYTEQHCCAIGSAGIESIANKWDSIRGKYKALT